MGHQFVDSGHLGEEAAHFLGGQDGGEAFRAFGGGEEDGFDFFVEDFAVEEEDGTEGLVLGQGGDVSFAGQVGEEGSDFRGVHFGGVAFVVEEDEAAHPVDVGFFGAVGVVFDAQGVAELVEEFFSHL